MSRTGAATLAGVLTLSLASGACGRDDRREEGREEGRADAASTLAGTITVDAAASLTDAFAELGVAFEAAHPGTEVDFNFAASSALREQILAGAPVDVFASANGPNMDRVVEAGAAARPADFAANDLQIAVPAGNPAGIDGLADFADEDLLLGLCAAEAPCGQSGREALANAGVTPAVDTEEPDVRSLLTKVAEGELDAGIVYRTDVRSAGDAVEGIEIPAADNVTVAYPIAVLTGAANRDLAEAFVTFVLSEAGQAILAAHGFAPAP